jgi:RND family efflux transporter MFP subunit
MTGVVVDRAAALGAPVAPGDRLFRVVDLQPVRVVADVFERNLHEVAIGQAVRITTTAQPGRVYRGTVEALAPQVDDERRAAQVVTILENRDEALRPGMFATARLEVAGEEQPAVPASALLTDDDGAFLLVMDAATTFRRVYVDADASAGGVVPVPDVPLGAVVVSEGAYRIVSQMNQAPS